MLQGKNCGQCLQLKDLAGKGTSAFMLADDEQRRSTERWESVLVQGGVCGSGLEVASQEEQGGLVVGRLCAGALGRRPRR